MNTAALRARGGGGAGSGPLPFSVESLLEAERGPDSEPTEPGEEKPLGAVETRAWVPPAALACPLRKCPASRSPVLSSARPAWMKTRAERALSLITYKVIATNAPSLSAKKENCPPEPCSASRPSSYSCIPLQAGFGPVHNPRLFLSRTLRMKHSLSAPCPTHFRPRSPVRASRFFQVDRVLIFPGVRGCGMKSKARIHREPPLPRRFPALPSLAPAAFGVSKGPVMNGNLRQQPAFAGVWQCQDNDLAPAFVGPFYTSLSFQEPPARHPASSENTRTTASRGRPSLPRSCWRWSASSTRNSTCPSLSAPSSPAA